MQKYFQNFCKPNFYLRKNVNVLIHFKGLYANIYAKFLCKNCAICFLLFKAFQKAIKSKNPMTGSGSKYRFSRENVKIRHSGSVPKSGIKVPFPA